MKKFAQVSAVVSLLFVLTLSLGAAAQTDNLKINAAYVTTAPQIDGMLNDAAWVTASQLGAKTVVDLSSASTSITPFPRVAYLAFDEEALYVLFVNYSPSPEALAVSSDTVWHNDEVEVFIHPAGMDYRQVIVDAAGRMNDEGELLGVKVAINKTDIQWIVEMAIPFASLGQTPKAGDVWRLNLTGRQVADGDTWVAWNPTYGGFHNAARFGELHFVAP